MAEKMTPQGLVVGLIPEEETPQEQPREKEPEKVPATRGRKPKGE